MIRAPATPPSKALERCLAERESGVSGFTFRTGMDDLIADLDQALRWI